MQTWNASLLCKENLTLGEGTIWHPGWKKFLFVDIEEKIVGCIDIQTKVVEKISVDKKIGTVVPSNNNNLIIALQGSIEELVFATGKTKQLIKIENEKPANRCNDGKCDAAGRLWIGTMNADAMPGKGALYKFDGELTKMIDKTSISNGICWSGDNKTMYYIDSYDYNIKAYDFELKTGKISNERVVVMTSNPEQTPDGMCIDEEGMLWVAIWGGAAVHRYNPFDGKLIGIVKVDALNVTSCALGGKSMDQLFITTARADLGEADLQQYPLSGSLFISETKVKGVPTNFFSSPSNF